jgi:hypothetical protein
MSVPRAWSVEDLPINAAFADLQGQEEREIRYYSDSGKWHNRVTGRGACQAEREMAADCHSEFHLWPSLRYYQMPEGG